jgi:hypothetical protein
MNAEPGESEPNRADAADDYDREIFTRLGVMTIVWIVLLVVAGLLLLFFGPSLADLVV